MAIDPGIFKAYDIRGLHGEQIDGETALAIGRGFARVLAKLSGKPVTELRVGLGRDMRLTAPELAARYREGLLMEGADVLDAGQVGTEMLYYLVGSRELDGGLMCTASHNPKAYTGAKLVRDGAIALSGDAGIQDIRREIEAGLDGGAAELGVLQEVDVYEEFQAAALKLIDPDVIKPLKVVVDGGNGMAGPMVGPLLDRLGLDLIETYWTPDGNFPDHEPNPLLPENRTFIIEKLRETGADLGIAWDGDADRCFFIDDTGEFVDGDFLTALLAESLLAKRPGSAILYDVRASWAVPDTVKRAGGTPYINRVGHAFFKTRMREEGSLFGGEVSGHYYFRDFYCADSGTIPALLILEQLSLARQAPVRSVEALPRALLHLRRDQHRGRRPAGQDAGDSRALLRCQTGLARRRLDRLRGLALQRTSLEHRAPVAPVPGVAALARAHAECPRRGARADPLVRQICPMPRAHAGGPCFSVAFNSRGPAS